MEIRVRNVNDALREGIDLVTNIAYARSSRNGDVLVMPEPTTTTYQRPTERVLFNPARDANPFFHLFESLWMLAGRDDVAFVERFVKRMRTFSDDGKSLHGAYGKRWIGWFGRNQLDDIIAELRRDPNSRRCVISMWDGHEDLWKAMNGGKDVPCNTAAYVWIDEGGRLCLTLLNRSNDLIWGAYGANAVHFSYLQEYLAAGVGVPVGQMFQMSNNLHAYQGVLDEMLAAGIDGTENTLDPYATGEVEPYPLVSTPLDQWNQDLSAFMDVGPTLGLRDPFFRRVAIPMWLAHLIYKSGNDLSRYEEARHTLQNCDATDWRRAAEEWLNRREAAQRRKIDEAA